MTKSQFLCGWVTSAKLPWSMGPEYFGRSFKSRGTPRPICVTLGVFRCRLYCQLPESTASLFEPLEQFTNPRLAKMNLLPFASIWLLFAPALAQTFNLTIDSTTCIAPSDFNTCYATAVGSETTCITVAGANQDAVLACGCVGYLDKMNCFASACWNRVRYVASPRN